MKDIFVLQVENEMRKQKINKSKLASLLKTSRTVVNRVLDKNDNGVSLKTLIRVSKVLGFSLSIRLIDEVVVKDEETK